MPKGPPLAIIRKRRGRRPVLHGGANRTVSGCPSPARQLHDSKDAHAFMMDAFDRVRDALAPTGSSRDWTAPSSGLSWTCMASDARSVSLSNAFPLKDQIEARQDRYPMTTGLWSPPTLPHISQDELDALTAFMDDLTSFRRGAARKDASTLDSKLDSAQGRKTPTTSRQSPPSNSSSQQLTEKQHLFDGAT